MNRLIFAATALTAFFSVQANAQEEGAPISIKQALQESRAICDPGRSTTKKGFIARRDVNGDQVPDYILDYDKFECDGSKSFCGSGGCTMQVFASMPDGSFKKVMDDTVRGLKFVKLKGRAAVIVDQHGSACGRAGSEPCAVTLYWNGARFSPAN